MDVINRDQADAFTTKDSSTIREILAPRNSSILRQSLAEATIGPGASTQAHYHPGTEEIYYILQGSAIMAIGEEKRVVGVGDAISIPPGDRHQILNTGSGDLVFLCCCVPAYSDSDTIMCDPLLSV
jgi:mannose-6-phosphate isomerase-like protein (cupin superfamily)